MERANHHCILIIYIIGILLLMAGYLSSDNQEALSSWSYMDGYSITNNIDGYSIANNNIFCEMECCKYCESKEWNRPKTLAFNEDNVKYSDVFVALNNLLISLISLFICEIVSEKVDCSKEKMQLCFEVMVITFVLTTILVMLIAALWHRAYARRIRMRDKVPKKIDDRGPIGRPDCDEEERSELELLPLHMMVRLKKTPADSLTALTAAKKKKQGCHFPEHDQTPFHHCFEFHRDQQFRTKIIANPATVSFASHFVSGSFDQPGTGQDLHKEGVRLATFKDFPPTIPVSALRLAQAGFYYLGQRDQVKCFSCGQMYGNWQPGDRPASIHAHISPNCALVQGNESTNMPLPLPLTNLPNFTDTQPSLESGYGSAVLGAESLSGPGSSLAGPGSASTLGPGSDQAGSGRPMTVEAMDSGQLLTNTGASDVTTTRSQASEMSTLTTSMASLAVANEPSPSPSGVAMPENSTSSSTQAQGLASPFDGGAPRNLPPSSRRLDLGGAVYPLYSQHDARKRSFSSWNASFPPVEELVTLGFFYAGYADCVRCFFCGIGLKSWETQDIPAEVHARWRPTCEYLRLVKGDEYVDMIANGGENVADRGNRTNAGEIGQGSGNAQPGRGDAQSQQGTSPTLPNVPVVNRARQSGYTDAQIAEAIDKLRVIGMEGAMEVMLLEILINLFSNDTSRSSGAATNQPASNTGAADSLAPSTLDRDMQNDGTEEVADNAAAALDERALQDRHHALQQENARLRNLRTCQRCQERQVGVIFLPCGHIIACTECAPSIRTCTRCDTVIRATANVFFS